MKEQACDGKTFTGIVVPDGWHEIEIQDGIDYVKSKNGEIYRDDKDCKAWKIPMKVKNDDDPANGGIVGCTAFEANGGDLMATILDAAGLWKTICEKFPGDETVFASKIMDGVKTRLPGKTFMIESRLDKAGFSKVISVASYAKYKELMAGKKDGKKEDKKNDKKETEAVKSDVSGTGDGW